MEDDYLLNKTISLYLSGKGYDVHACLNGNEALNAINGIYDVAILDIDIPDFSGLEILNEIRKLYPSLPVIMISATIDINTVSKAYEIGCSDYLKKPFDIRELDCKIQAFTRMHTDILELGGGLSYQKHDQQLFLHAEPIVLTPKEQKLFHILIENRGKTVSPENLLNAIWGFDADTAHLRQLVARLRKKLPENIIENRTGSGYCIV